MHRIFFLAFGLSLLFVTCVSAETFFCKTPDGELVMTDRQDRLPADCKPVNEPTDEGSFSVIPDVPSVVPSVPVSDNESQPALSEAVGTPGAPVDQDEYLGPDRRLTPHEANELRKNEAHNDLPEKALTHEQEHPVRHPQHESPRK